MLDEHRMLSASYKGGKICYKDDLVLNRLKAHLGVFALAPQFGVISPDYTVLVPNTEKILPIFAETVLKSRRCRRELQIRVRGIIEAFGDCTLMIFIRLLFLSLLLMNRGTSWIYK